MADCIDSERGRLYGVTYPQAHFLSYDIESGKTTELGRVQKWQTFNRHHQIYALKGSQRP